jgi:hypothetical protein
MLLEQAGEHLVDFSPVDNTSYQEVTTLKQ